MQQIEDLDMSQSSTMQKALALKTSIIAINESNDLHWGNQLQGQKMYWSHLAGYP